MKFWVVLLALAIVCRADDDDSDEDMSFTYQEFKPIINPFLKTHLPAEIPAPLVKSNPTPLIKVSLPSHVPVVKSFPTPVTHGASLSPAVVKIPKPGIRFNVPVPQAHGVGLPIEKTAPIQAQFPIQTSQVMPKTVLETQEAMFHVPAVVDTLKSDPMSVQSPILKAAPETIEAPKPNYPIIPSTVFSQNIEQLSAPYYISSTNYKSTIPSVIEVPAADIPSNFGIPLPITPLANAIPYQTVFPVAESLPIQYSTVSKSAIPSMNMPFMGASFQQDPQTLTYWRDFQYPQQMNNFMDLNTGGFSFVNFIGDASSVMPQVPETTPLQDSFKATQFQFSNVAPVKVAAEATPSNARSSAAGSGVIAA